MYYLPHVGAVAHQTGTCSEKPNSVLGWRKVTAQHGLDLAPLTWPGPASMAARRMPAKVSPYALRTPAGRVRAPRSAPAALQRAGAELVEQLAQHLFGVHGAAAAWMRAVTAGLELCLLLLVRPRAGIDHRRVLAAQAAQLSIWSSGRGGGVDHTPSLVAWSPSATGHRGPQYGLAPPTSVPCPAPLPAAADAGLSRSSSQLILATRPFCAETATTCSGAPSTSVTVWRWRSTARLHLGGRIGLVHGVSILLSTTSRVRRILGPADWSRRISERITPVSRPGETPPHCACAMGLMVTPGSTRPRR